MPGQLLVAIRMPVVQKVRGRFRHPSGWKSDVVVPWLRSGARTFDRGLSGAARRAAIGRPPPATLQCP
jgi:hypothetical protein